MSDLRDLKHPLRLKHHPFCPSRGLDPRVHVFVVDKTRSPLTGRGTE